MTHDVQGPGIKLLQVRLIEAQGLHKTQFVGVFSQTGFR